MDDEQKLSPRNARIPWGWVNIIFWTLLLGFGAYAKLTEPANSVPDYEPPSDHREPLRGR